MEVLKLEIKAKEGIKIPEIQNNGTYEVYAPHNVSMEPKSTTIVKFGWKMLLPKFHVLNVVPSDLSDRRNIYPTGMSNHNYIEKHVDFVYPSELSITFENRGEMPYEIKKDEHICSFYLVKVEPIAIDVVEVFTDVSSIDIKNIDITQIKDMPKDFHYLRTLNKINLSEKYQPVIDALIEENPNFKASRNSDVKKININLWEKLDDEDKSRIIQKEVDDFEDEFINKNKRFISDKSAKDKIENLNEIPPLFKKNPIYWMKRYDLFNNYRSIKCETREGYASAYWNTMTAEHKKVVLGKFEEIEKAIEPKPRTRKSGKGKEEPIIKKAGSIPKKGKEEQLPDDEDDEDEDVDDI